MSPYSDFAPHGPGRIARQNVDLAVLERLKARLRRQRHEPHPIRVAERRRRDRAADIDVEARPGPAFVHVGEARQALVDAAQNRAARLDHVERLGRGAGCGEDKRDRCERGPKACQNRRSKRDAHAETRQVRSDCGRLAASRTPCQQACESPGRSGLAGRAHPRGRRRRRDRSAGAWPDERARPRQRPFGRSPCPDSRPHGERQAAIGRPEGRPSFDGLWPQREGSLARAYFITRLMRRPSDGTSGRNAAQASPSGRRPQS